MVLSFARIVSQKLKNPLLPLDVSMFLSINLFTFYIILLETDDSREEHRRNQEQKEFPVLNSSSIPLSSNVIDHEIEIQLAEWNKNADMLFSIHPMDGSLLVWHVDWLDEYQPGMFRQVQVLQISRYYVFKNVIVLEA